MIKINTNLKNTSIVNITLNEDDILDIIAEKFGLDNSADFNWNISMGSMVNGLTIKTVKVDEEENTEIEFENITEYFG